MGRGNTTLEWGMRLNRYSHSCARFLALAIAAPMVLTAAPQERDRSKIPDRYKWNLADIYPSDTAWRAAKDAFSADLSSLGRIQGKVMLSPSALADALDMLYSKEKDLGRLETYASLLADQDTRDSAHQGMRQEMTQAGAAFRAAAAFVDPEILKAGKEQIEKFMA